MLTRRGSLFQNILAQREKFTEKGYGSIKKIYVWIEEDKIFLPEFQNWQMNNCVCIIYLGQNKPRNSLSTWPTFKLRTLYTKTWWLFFWSPSITHLTQTLPCKTSLLHFTIYLPWKHSFYLWCNLFQVCWSCSDVFAPRKSYKSGRRFAFIRVNSFTVMESLIKTLNFRWIST